MTAVRTLLTEGYVVLPSRIPEEICIKLRNWMENHPGEGEYNYFEGHDQQPMPIDGESIPWGLMYNEDVHDIVRGVLGSGYTMNSYTCNRNNAMVAQPYHMDCSHYHGEEAREVCGTGPPMELIVNVYLQDTTEANGAFDILPRTHLEPVVTLCEDGEIPPEALAPYEPHHRPLSGPTGTIIIRDKRTWHRGAPNPSNTPRYMVGIRFSSRLFRTTLQRFNTSAREGFASAPFDTSNITFE